MTSNDYFSSVMNSEFSCLLDLGAEVKKKISMNEHRLSSDTSAVSRQYSFIPQQKQVLLWISSPGKQRGQSYRPWLDLLKHFIHVWPRPTSVPFPGKRQRKRNTSLPNLSVLILASNSQPVVFYLLSKSGTRCSHSTGLNRKYFKDLYVLLIC